MDPIEEEKEEDLEALAEEKESEVEGRSRNRKKVGRKGKGKENRARARGRGRKEVESGGVAEEKQEEKEEQVEQPRVRGGRRRLSARELDRRPGSDVQVQDRVLQEGYRRNASGRLENHYLVVPPGNSANAMSAGRWMPASQVNPQVMARYRSIQAQARQQRLDEGERGVRQNNSYLVRSSDPESKSFKIVTRMRGGMEREGRGLDVRDILEDAEGEDESFREEKGEGSGTPTGLSDRQCQARRELLALDPRQAASKLWAMGPEERAEFCGENDLEAALTGEMGPVQCEVIERGKKAEEEDMKARRETEGEVGVGFTKQGRGGRNLERISKGQAPLPKRRTRGERNLEKASLLCAERYAREEAGRKEKGEEEKGWRLQEGASRPRSHGGWGSSSGAGGRNRSDDGGGKRKRSASREGRAGEDWKEAKRHEKQHSRRRSRERDEKYADSRGDWDARVGSGSGGRQSCRGSYRREEEARDRIEQDSREKERGARY